MALEDKHVQKLKDLVKEEVTSEFEQILDFAQVACPEAQFKQLRSKILRVGNNCIRNINKGIDDNFKIEYVAPGEDVIEFGQGK